MGGSEIYHEEESVCEFLFSESCLETVDMCVRGMLLFSHSLELIVSALASPVFVGD